MTPNHALALLEKVSYARVRHLGLEMWEARLGGKTLACRWSESGARTAAYLVLTRVTK